MTEELLKQADELDEKVYSVENDVRSMFKVVNDINYCGRRNAVRTTIITSNLYRRMKDQSKLIQALSTKVREQEWQPKELFEKECTAVIGWLTTDKGFQDTTAMLLYCKGRWNWGDDEEEPVKRQDMILGVKPWPEPPIPPKNDN